tara:strand:+ start:371 stop:634 length:264 start_codon:yes stop_codon:yes gene_type:complete
MKKIRKLPPYPSKDLDSDQFLEQSNLEDLTDFFYNTESLSHYENGRKLSRAMASYFLAQKFLDLVVAETLNDKEIFITHDQEEGTIH